MEQRYSLGEVLKEIYRAGPEMEGLLADLLIRILEKLTEEERKR